jgi:hypothetical protein
LESGVAAPQGCGELPHQERMVEAKIQARTTFSSGIRDAGW